MRPTDSNLLFDLFEALSTSFSGGVLFLSRLLEVVKLGIDC